MHHLRTLAAALLIIPALAACDDPLIYSTPVAINLKAKSDDVKSGTISEEKSITTESGNPYGKFVAEARAALGGRNPSRVEVSSLTLLLGARSTGVTTLHEVFGGRVDVLFLMNESNNSYPAAYADKVQGPGPVPLEAIFDSRTLGPADYQRLLAGSFKVVIRGPAAAGFTSTKSEAELQLTFGFAGYE